VKREGRPRGYGPEHVLVVEDDESINKLLKIVLERGGYIVRVVDTYAGAMSAVQDAPPSLVVLDLGLPDGNGLDLLKWIRADLGLSLPVVVLSAFRQEEKVGKAFELGANDFMSKPFRPQELMSRIQRVLDV
jgi:DNA-binding response OmpR family regulator